MKFISYIILSFHLGFTLLTFLYYFSNILGLYNLPKESTYPYIVSSVILSILLLIGYLGVSKESIKNPTKSQYEHAIRSTNWIKLIVVIVTLLALLGLSFYFNNWYIFIITLMVLINGTLLDLKIEKNNKDIIKNYHSNSK